MPTADPGELAGRLGGLPIVDQHCHTLVHDWRVTAGAGPDGVPGWRRCFTEAVRPASLTHDVPAMRGYRELLRALGRRLDLDDAAPGATVEAAVCAARDSRAADEGYAADLLDDAGVATLLVDTGYGDERSLAVEELARVTGREIWTIVRVESVVERILTDAGGASTPGAFRTALDRTLTAALDAGAVGLKSIAAYRTGLELPEPTTGAIRRALADRESQRRRLDDPALVALALRTAIRIGAERGVPVQIHTGFGDEDIRLPLADPTLLRPLLRGPGMAACPIVLLHAYPFVAQAAYLASVFPQVYLDLSLTIPLLGHVGARAAIAEALGLCPATKLLAASDGHSYPEMHWHGARLWREALTGVLVNEVHADRMDANEAVSLARGILADNARRLYRLGPPAPS